MVVLIKSGNKWIPATLTSWSSEQELQEVLADSPELMPGCEGSAVVTELRIPGVGSVDLVCVHDTGAITLVECKLAKRPNSPRR
jgi:RecB family endonuclease NucS